MPENQIHNPAMGDPALRVLYGRVRGKVAFIDESYRAPRGGDVGFYTLTGSLLERDNMPAVRRALLKVTGGRPWHTTEALVDQPAVIARMTETIAVHANNSTLVVSTPWMDGSADHHRGLALRTLVAGLTRQGANLLVLDGSRPTTEARDRATIHAMRASGEIPRSTIAKHSSDDVEALLWLPDTVGWAFQRLVSVNEVKWTENLIDVVAVKEAAHDGWVDLTAMRAAAVERRAHADLMAQVKQIRAAFAPKSGDRLSGPPPQPGLSRRRNPVTNKGPEL